MPTRFSRMCPSRGSLCINSLVFACTIRRPLTISIRIQSIGSYTSSSLQANLRNTKVRSFSCYFSAVIYGPVVSASVLVYNMEAHAPAQDQAANPVSPIG